VKTGLWQSQNKKSTGRLLRRIRSSQRLAEGASAKLQFYIIKKHWAITSLPSIFSFFGSKVLGNLTSICLFGLQLIQYLIFYCNCRWGWKTYFVLTA